MEISCGPPTRTTERPPRKRSQHAATQRNNHAATRAQGYGKAPSSRAEMSHLRHAFLNHFKGRAQRSDGVALAHDWRGHQRCWGM
jgi:hypothetical protein